MEHCEHSRWSCQRNNSSLRINFSVRKKASLCYHSIMAFICNLDLGWLLSNAFSLCYQEGKKPVQFAGSFTGSNGASRSPPSLPWPLLAEAWKQGKGLKKLSWREVGAVQGVGNKQGFLQGKSMRISIPVCFPALVCGFGEQKGWRSLQFLVTKPLTAAATLVSHRTAQGADHCLQTSALLPDFCERLV